MRRWNMLFVMMLVAVGLLVVSATTPALAQDEQFIPLLVYRTGPYAPNGIPIANGYIGP